jgi:hypothetical protein
MTGVIDASGPFLRSSASVHEIATVAARLRQVNTGEYSPVWEACFRKATFSAQLPTLVDRLSTRPSG